MCGRPAAATSAAAEPSALLHVAERQITFSGHARPRTGSLSVAVPLNNEAASSLTMCMTRFTMFPMVYSDNTPQRREPSAPQ